MAMASWSKKNILEFIDVYRTKECLWKIKSKDYSNRLKRDKAYEDLISYVRTFYKDANKDTVVNKITNLRNSWRKQLRKQNSAQLSGLKEDEGYEPTLFYFDNLKFIADCGDSVEATRTGGSGRDIGDNESESLDFVANGENSLMEKYPEIKVDRDFDSDTDMTYDELDTSIPSAAAPTHATAATIAAATTATTRATRLPTYSSQHQQQHQRSNEAEEEHNILAVCRKLIAGQPLSNNAMRDEYEVFGQTVAHRLRKMSWEQSIHAQKLISDILYEGSFEGLSRESSVHTS